MAEGALCVEDNDTDVRACCDSQKYRGFSLESRSGCGLR